MSAIDPAPARGLSALPWPGAFLRAARRAAVFVAVFALGYPLLFLGRLLLAASPRLQARFSSAFFRRWARAALRALGVRVRTTGAAPAPPFFLVANHRSYLDVLVLASHLSCVFLARSEIRQWPVWGGICSALGTLYVDRGRKRDLPRALQEIEAALDRGMGVAFFPEGASTTGATVLPFKSSLFFLPARRGSPVYHATLRYATPPGEPPAASAVCFREGLPFGRHVWTLLGLRGIEASLHVGPEPIVDADRRRLAERLRAAILARLTAGT